MEKTYEKENWPLFKEKARHTHPETSHQRAAFLTESGELCRMMKFTLYLVYNHPGKTARELKDIIFNSNHSIEQMEWPQKCMKQLVDEGFVRREKNCTALKCFITRDGKKRLGVI